MHFDDFSCILMIFQYCAIYVYIKITYLLKNIKMYFKKSFYGLIKYWKNHSTQYGVDRNPDNISILNLEFSYFRGFRNGNAYGAACKDSEAKSHSQRSGTLSPGRGACVGALCPRRSSWAPNSPPTGRSPSPDMKAQR